MKEFGPALFLLGFIYGILAGYFIGARRIAIRIPLVLRFSKLDDLVYLAVFGCCVYARAGKRRKLLGVVWGNN